MLTCKSPRKVMRAAHALGCRCLRPYSSKFSRHDFTLPQLFACLVVREQMEEIKGTREEIKGTRTIPFGPPFAPAV